MTLTLGVKESGERIGEAQMTLLIFMTVVTFLEDGAALLIILICTCLLIGQLIFPWRAFHSGIFLIVYLGGVLVLALYSAITTANPKLPPFRWVVFFLLCQLQSSFSRHRTYKSLNFYVC